MERAYYKQLSRRLGREMELLIFGHAGLPLVAFPTSGGRFYEFEDQGDAWYLERFHSNQFILATGWDDPCLGQNQELDRILSGKRIPHRLHVWNESNSHDWPTWRRMVRCTTDC